MSRTRTIGEAIVLTIHLTTGCDARVWGDERAEDEEVSRLHVDFRPLPGDPYFSRHVLHLPRLRRCCAGHFRESMEVVERRVADWLGIMGLDSERFLQLMREVADG